MRALGELFNEKGEKVARALIEILLEIYPEETRLIPLWNDSLERVARYLRVNKEQARKEPDCAQITEILQSAGYLFMRGVTVCRLTEQGKSFYEQIYMVPQ